jgi:tripartite-type tricarboxylate transporter receptor subunit TctC
MYLQFVLNSCALTLVTLCASSAYADYPDRPIKMIVAWPSGGGTDNVARIVAKFLGDRLNQQVIVENKSGASGLVGTEYVSRAAPDGYTIQYTVADSHSINPHVFSNVKYDALKDFIPVSIVGAMPSVLAVNPKVSANNLSQFIAYAKAHPGELTFSSWGVGSGGHIRTAAFNDYAKINMLHVPYQGSAPAFAAVVSGQVDATIVPLSLALANAQAGRVKIMGVDTPQRVPSSSDIPTFTEQGIPLTLTFWQALMVPAKTPDEIVTLLNKEMLALLSNTEAKIALTKAGVSVSNFGASSLPELKSYMSKEYVRWGGIIKSANITAQP